MQLQAASISSFETQPTSGLGFQHTPALLELAQSGSVKKDSAEGNIKTDSAPIPSDSQQAPSEVISVEMPGATKSEAINQITGQLLETNKMEESENKLVESLEDNDDENMIVVSSSEVKEPAASNDDEEV